MNNDNNEKINDTNDGGECSPEKNFIRYRLSLLGSVVGLFDRPTASLQTLTKDCPFVDFSRSRQCPLQVGMVRPLDQDWDEVGLSWFVDTSFNPWLLYCGIFCVVLCIVCPLFNILTMTFGSSVYSDPLLKMLLPYVVDTLPGRTYPNPQGPQGQGHQDQGRGGQGEIVRASDLRQRARTLVTMIDNEIAEGLQAGTVADITWGDTRVIVSENWLLRMKRYQSVLVMAVSDVRFAQQPRLVGRYVGSEFVELVSLTMISPRAGAAPFQLDLPREMFQSLEQRLWRRVAAVQAAVREQTEETFLQEFTHIIEQRWVAQTRTEDQDQDQDQRLSGGAEGGRGGLCLGECGAGANVRIIKQCQSCPERDSCFCAPAWCHSYLLKVSRSASPFSSGLWSAVVHPTSRPAICHLSCRDRYS